MMSQSTTTESRMQQYRLWVFIGLIALIPIGLASKFYQGLLEDWVNNSLGGVFYEMFWILLIVYIKPQYSTKKVAISVFIITTILEFLQLWKPPFLQAIRLTLIGRLLLGTTFVWWDIPYYILGCILAGLGLHYLKAKIWKC